MKNWTHTENPVQFCRTFTNPKTMKQFLLILSLLITQTPFFAQETERWSVEFEFDQHALTPEGVVTLQDVLDFYSFNNGQRIDLLGHTDNVGNKAYNQKLSQRRAASVKEYLTANGISENQITVNAFDYSIPTADNSEETGRAKNRRTEVVLHYTIPVEQISLQPTVSKPRSSSYEIEPLESDPIDTVATVIQEPMVEQTIETTVYNSPCGEKSGKKFVFTDNSNYTIQGVHGAKLYFKSTNLENHAQLDSSNLEIVLNEYLSPKHITCTGASTSTRNGMLQSAGMVRIQITSDKVETVSGCIVVEIPFKEIDGMRPYVSTIRGTARTAVWRRRSDRNMTYDKEKGVYRIQYCGNLSRGFGINVDKKVPTLLVRIKKVKEPYRAFYVLHQDSTISGVNKVKSNHILGFNYYSFPLVDEGRLITYSKDFDRSIDQSFKFVLNHNKKTKYKFRYQGMRYKRIKKRKNRLITNTGFVMVKNKPLKKKDRKKLTQESR